MNTIKLPYKGNRAFSLIDLLIALFISSIILVGTFKAFMTNVETTTGTIDLAKLDDTTRKLVEVLHSDIVEVNGDTINGMPTVFPLFRSDGTIKGFVLVKAEKRLPIFNMYDPTFTPPATTAPASVKLKSSLPSIHYDAIKTGMFAMLYNFRNYSWIPYKIVAKSQDGIYPVLDVQKFPKSADSWTSYLISEPCVSFKFGNSSSSEDMVCNSNGEYQQSNTVFLIGDIIEYELGEEKILRTMNSDNLNRSVVADGVKTFETIFRLKRNPVFSAEARQILTTKASMDTLIHDVNPWSGRVTEDDCKVQIGYRCKEVNIEAKTYSLVQLSYPYISTRIEGIQMKFRVEHKSGKGNTVNMFLSLDENHGNAGLSAFNPTKVIPKKDTTVARDYGSLIANPTIYHDPEGGATSAPLFTAAAPMISAVSTNKDPANDSKLTNLCTNCPGGPGNCPSNYPQICNSDKNANTTKDYLECSAADAAKRTYLGCMNPQGTLNDRGLDLTTNKIDPRIAFLNNQSAIQWEYIYDMRNQSECGYFGFCTFWQNYYVSSLRDTPFPLTIFPYFSPQGELLKYYIGVARLRMPESTATQNYHPEYHSVVLPVTAPNLPGMPIYLFDDDTSIIYNKDSTDDIASVSSLQIRKEGVSEYMYLASHETNKIMYRKRLTTQWEQDLAWSTITKAFEDNEALFPMKFSWWYREKNASGDYEDHFVPYPSNAMENYDTKAPQYEKRRITALLTHSDGRIYYCTPQMTPDEMINGEEKTAPGVYRWFYENPVTYKRPIIHPVDKKRYTCDPTIADANNVNSYLYPKCTLGAYQEKPIDWAICLSPANKVACYGTDEEYSQNYPVASKMLPSFDGKLKVAFKSNDTTWTIKTVANLHETCNGLSQDPSTGDIVISAATNMAKISYDEMNKVIAQNETPPDIDLGFYRYDNVYTANNVLAGGILGQGSATDSFELRRLAGLNAFPHAERLNIVFSDMVNRITGYAIQGRNPYEKQIFAQIIYNDSKDRNTDDIAAYVKGSVDKEESFARWILPFNSTKVWADGIRQDIAGGGMTFAIAPPIPLRPPSNITDYSLNGGAHNRLLSSNPATCFANPTDPKVCPGGVCTCGQDIYFRECEGDVLAQVSMGLMGRQEGTTGCGVGSPASLAKDDPTNLPAPTIEEMSTYPVQDWEGEP